MIENKIVKTLIDAKEVVIVGHENPDGDCIGSMLALYLALKKKGKNVRIISKDVVPKNLYYLPHVNDIEIINNANFYCDVLVLLDTGEIERTGISNIEKIYKKLINIDHHITSNGIGNLYYVNSSAAACGEIIYQLIKLMGIDNDKEIATCLYTAIYTDTGGFKYSNTTSITHQIAGDLINMGINFSDIAYKAFDQMSISKFNLIKDVLNTIEFFENNRIAFLYVFSDMFIKNGAKREDTENIVNFARNIESVEVAAIFIEEQNKYKISMRSKNYINVADIASKFGGGGHEKAAGFSSEDPLEDIKNKLINYIKSDERWMEYF